MVVGVVTLLPLVSGYCCWLMAISNVGVHNGHDRHDYKQLFVDDLEKIMCNSNKSEQGIRVGLSSSSLTLVKIHKLHNIGLLIALVRQMQQFISFENKLKEQ